MGDFVVDQVLVGMATDSSRYTHPISVRVSNSQQIKEMFDPISYNKGAGLETKTLLYSQCYAEAK